MRTLFSLQSVYSSTDSETISEGFETTTALRDCKTGRGSTEDDRLWILLLGGDAFSYDQVHFAQQSHRRPSLSFPLFT
jgi:hypothetical protein